MRDISMFSEESPAGEDRFCRMPVLSNVGEPTSRVKPARARGTWWYSEGLGPEKSCFRDAGRNWCGFAKFWVLGRYWKSGRRRHEKYGAGLFLRWRAWDVLDATAVSHILSNSQAGFVALDVDLLAKSGVIRGLLRAWRSSIV
jgi:hypothetical protein